MIDINSKATGTVVTRTSQPDRVGSDSGWSLFSNHISMKEKNNV
jgi:hypothetical protein